MESNVDTQIKSAYAKGELYKAESICERSDSESQEYTVRLLGEKLHTIERYSQGKTSVLDLCCASGEHLLYFDGLVENLVGVDFTETFIESARSKLSGNEESKISFDVGNAKELEYPPQSFDVVYSLSSLYAIPEVNYVIDEVVRVLKPGGYCILDFGSSNSINNYCISKYTEYPPTFPVPYRDIVGLCNSNNLEVCEWRSFQILPLWADRPSWLRPLLHPLWKKLLSKRVMGKMLDEWLSSLPFFKPFAFRHLIVCKKV